MSELIFIMSSGSILVLFHQKNISWFVILCNDEHLQVLRIINVCRGFCELFTW